MIAIPDLMFERSGVWEIALTVSTGAGVRSEEIVFKLAVADQAAMAVDPDSDLSKSTPWTPMELELLQALMLEPEESAELSESQFAKAKLGHHLFFDESLSPHNRVSCATCHRPRKAFSSFEPLVDGEKISNDVPSLIGVSEYFWFNRSGSKDSLWSQAQGPLESDQEIGSSRAALVHKVFSSSLYTQLYTDAFGAGVAEHLLDPDFVPTDASPVGSPSQRAAWVDLPDSIKHRIDRFFVNILKSLAAYQEQLVASPARFDFYVRELGRTQKEVSNILTEEEVEGLKLFISGKTRCLQCHTGPHFTDQQFHNIGTLKFSKSDADQSHNLPGRTRGVERLMSDLFNCKSAFSDAGNCDHLDSLAAMEISYLQTGALKTPGLRNLAHTAPYMNDGSLSVLEDVIKHYQLPPESTDLRAAHELTAIRNLSDNEVRKLALFLRTLTSPIPVENLWYRAPELPDALDK